MKISEIRGYHVECVLPEPVRNAVARFERRAALVVEILSDTGHSGWGECTQFPFATWAFLESALAGKLIGSDPLMSGPLWRSLAGLAGGDMIAMMAVSAIDMALLDIRGRIENRPVSALLGGRLRDRVRAYASGPFMKLGDDPYRGFETEAEALLRSGFRAIKARSGASPKRDAEMAAALRRTVGPNTALMVDFNRGYARAAALDALSRIEDVGLLWAEEPIAAQDRDGYRHLRDRTTVPLAAGEALWRLPQFTDVLADGSLSVVQPDLYMCGGFTGALKVAAVAEGHSTCCVPHVWGTAVNFHASLQLVSLLPSYRFGDGQELPMFEWDQSDNALLRVAGEPALDAEGAIAIPDGPGIGIEIERSMFEPYLKQSWRLTS